MLNYLILIVGWTIYFFLHSALASEEIKDQLIKLFKSNPRIYRLFYSLISTIGLVLLFLFLMTAPSIRLFETGGWGRYLGMVLATWGVIIMTIAFRKFSMGEFLGIKKDTSDDQLITSGLHGRIRHPLYSGVILLFAGMFLFIPTDLVAITCVIVYLYLPIGIRLEESKLINKFGQEYREYKKNTPSLIPKLW